MSGPRRRRPRGEGGAATLEMVGYLPIALIFLLVVFQVCTLMWAMVSLNEAARQGARADSLGRDGCAAAESTLSGYLRDVSCQASHGGGMYRPSTVTISAKVPVPSFIDEFVPDPRLTRTAFLP